MSTMFEVRKGSLNSSSSMIIASTLQCMTSMFPINFRYPILILKVCFISMWISHVCRIASFAYSEECIHDTKKCRSKWDGMTFGQHHTRCICIIYFASPQDLKDVAPQKNKRLLESMNCKKQFY